jgi:hypothetical protein
LFGVGLSIVYLFIFNRKIRQSLHKRLVGSHVVMADTVMATSGNGSCRWPSRPSAGWQGLWRRNRWRDPPRAAIERSPKWDVA